MRRNIHTIYVSMMATGLLAMSANAQNSDQFYDQQEQIGMSAGVKLTVPFGNTSKNKADKARLGLTLSLDHQTQNHWTGITKERSVNMLELGFFENGDPNVSLLGQDIYTSLFDPLYADDKDADKKSQKQSRDILLYMAGGAVVVVGAAYLVSEVIVNDVENCLGMVGQENARC